MINDNNVRLWWELFQSWRKNPLVEIRIIEGKRITSGYFSDPETMLQELHKVGDRGIYATINEINIACYERQQKDKMVVQPKSTTQDADISKRTCLFIDLDPKRPSDTNATDEELEKAKAKARRIYTFLKNEGFNSPIVAMSGNGVHLMYRIDIPCDDETDAIFDSFFSFLSKMFSDEDILIDKSIANRSRVAKLIGTTSPKGAESSTIRPQRESYFMSIPHEWKETKIEYLRKIAERDPKPEPVTYRYGNRNENFDLDAFLSEHHIEVANRSVDKDGNEKYVLEECPFCGHHAPDSAVFRLRNGGYGFLCFHNSCSGLGWKDFRLHFDPNAYDKKDYDEFSRKRRYDAPVRQEEIQESVEEESKGRVWMKASEFKFFDLKDAQAIPTGIPAIDKKTMGLILGEVSIVSGSSGAGKTTFLNHLILNAIQRNYRVALWSGEMAGGRIVGWIDQMAAGKNNVELVPGTDNLYSVQKPIRERINNWIGDRLWIYNNSYGQRWSRLYADIKKVIEEHGVNLILVDNLMSLDLDAYSGENNDKQKSFINALMDLAKQTNTHIILVAHPRKEAVNQLIRKESIAGTADLTNLAFNVFLLHRVGRDFERRGNEFFGPQKVQEMMEYNLVVEISKARTAGCQDLLVGLFYEPETRRLKNTAAESIVYGWDDAPIVSLADDGYHYLPDDDLPL